MLNCLAFWYARHRVAALMLGVALITCVTVGAHLGARWWRESEMLGLLELQAQRQVAELMALTRNGRIMGGLAVLGASEPALLADAQGATALNSAAMQDLLRRVGTTLQLEGLYVVGKDGVIRSSWGEGPSLSGVDVRFRAYAQAALQGRASVYAAIGTTTARRTLYFAVPLQARAVSGGGTDGATVASPEGALVARQSLAPVDALLSSYPGMAFLLSPQGLVFASNQPQWVGYMTGHLTPQMLKAIRDLRQFGNLFEQRAPESLPFDLGQSIQLVEGQRYGIARHSLDWEDPAGPWQLVLMQDMSQRIGWLPLLPFSLGYGLLALGLMLMTGRLLRGHRSQVLAHQALAEQTREQSLMAQRKERLAQLSLQLQQTASMQALGELFLSRCHAELGCLQGTVYLLQGTRAPVLERIASFGSDDSVPLHLQPGEGLVGQCALQPRVQCLRAPLPEGWRIHSGLGYSAASALMLAPIQLGDQVLGVCELAFLNPPEPQALALFEDMTGLLAFNVGLRQ